MSDRAEQIVRNAAEEIWGRRAPGAFDRWHTPDFQNHTAPPGVDSSLASFKKTQSGLLEAFSDTTLDVLDQVVEGDRVASRIRMRGTHSGTFMGIAPTGKAVEVSGMRLDRVENGRIAEHWAVIDVFGLTRQISASD